MFRFFPTISAKSVLFCCMTTMHGGAVSADGVPAMKFLDGVLICNEILEIVDVVDYLEANSLANLDQAIFAVEGCGRLKGPALSIIIDLAPMELESVVVTIAEIKFRTTDGMVTQYGLTRTVPKPALLEQDERL